MVSAGETFLPFWHHRTFDLSPNQLGFFFFRDTVPPLPLVQICRRVAQSKSPGNVFCFVFLWQSHQTNKKGTKTLNKKKTNTERNLHHRRWLMWDHKRLLRTKTHSPFTPTRPSDTSALTTPAQSSRDQIHRKWFLLSVFLSLFPFSFLFLCVSPRSLWMNKFPSRNKPVRHQKGSLRIPKCHQYTEKFIWVGERGRGRGGGGEGGERRRERGVPTGLLLTVVIKKMKKKLE